ncbi:MAG: helix-turn-helix domain-containing protein [Candidatus Kapabacteria bacterium]|jgi:chromosomal replication initiation ATPase DnaA|nr:helix-turn-helix domain-containing protein [Candidatus Kapabacteria bacterium]
MLDYPKIAQSLNIPDLEQRLKAKSRARRLVDVRRALSAILVEQGYSVREIAAELCRPHSTVVHFVQTHESLVITDTDYQHLVHQLKEITQWQS